jgi:hypothetical protein
MTHNHSRSLRFHRTFIRAPRDLGARVTANLRSSGLDVVGLDVAGALPSPKSTTTTARYTQLICTYSACRADASNRRHQRSSFHIPTIPVVFTPGRILIGPRLSPETAPCATCWSIRILHLLGARSLTRLSAAASGPWLTGLPFWLDLVSDVLSAYVRPSNASTDVSTLITTLELSSGHFVANRLQGLANCDQCASVLSAHRIAWLRWCRRLASVNSEHK